MSELPALPPSAALEVDVTRLARPLGLLVPVTFDGALWSFCESGAVGAGERLPPERVARYLLTGLVRALRRAGGVPPAVLPYRMALGRLELALAARVEATGVHVADMGAISCPARPAG